MKRSLSLVSAFLLPTLIAAGASAKVITRTVSYTDNDVPLEGYLAYDDSLSGKRPGVLIIHQWMGLSPYEQMRAKMLAELGYVAFALDMYGTDHRPKTMDDAAKTAGMFYNNRGLMRERAAAGLAQLKANDLVDTSRVAVIGYCFGGTCALELARSGAAVNGTVSFHGGLSTPTPEDAKNIKGKVLACHGGSDPHVTWDQVSAFRDEMTEAGVDWQLVVYGGAVHAFTQPGAGNDPSRGAAYNEKADHRSWEEMKHFFKEIF